MKAYLVTAGVIFGLLAVAHIWRAIAEWPQGGMNLAFVLGMGALIAVPGALSDWAWHLVCRRPCQQPPGGDSK